MATTPESTGGSDQSSYPVHDAVKHGKNDEVAALLDADVRNISAVDEHGRTPLHMAVLFQNLAAAEMLVAAGANCNEEDATGRTPLHLAGEYAFDLIGSPAAPVSNQRVILGSAYFCLFNVPLRLPPSS